MVTVTAIMIIVTLALPTLSTLHANAWCLTAIEWTSTGRLGIQALCLLLLIQTVALRLKALQGFSWNEWSVSKCLQTAKFMGGLFVC